MSHIEKPPRAEIAVDTEYFKQQSIQALKHSLSEMHYPGYPTERLTYEKGAYRRNPFGRYNLPHGPWNTNAQCNDWLSNEEIIPFQMKGIPLDYHGRPVHPWIDDMLSDPDLGAVTGKGFYWNWGPNYTADPIVFRDLDGQKEVLLIKRKDTGIWALPGGFVDEGEHASTASRREACEETGLVIPESVAPIHLYSGPVADIRTTANAWAETSAYVFELDDMTARDTVTGADDAMDAAWFPVDIALHDTLFGSHALLVEAALKMH